MDSRWANFFDLSAGCSVAGVAASCSSVTPDGYMEAQTRAFFGDQWYELVGNDNEIERAERDYELRLHDTINEYRKAQKAKKQPPPKLKPARKTKEQIEAEKKRNAGVGKDEGTPQETYHGVLGNIRFVAVDGTVVGDNKEKIRGQLQKMALSRKCNKLFKDAGLLTPDEIIQKGIIIGAASSLNDSSNDSAFGINEDQRKANLAATTTSNPLMFIGGVTNQGKDFSDGRARTWYTPDGIRKAFPETIIHELMHAGGAGRVSAWTGNDLSNFKQNGISYDDIIKACS